MENMDAASIELAKLGGFPEFNGDAVNIPNPEKDAFANNGKWLKQESSNDTLNPPMTPKKRAAGGNGDAPSKKQKV